MNKKALATIAAAIALGLIAVFLVNRYITQQEEEMYSGMELAKVIAVTEDVPAGTELTIEILAPRQMPEKYIHGNAVGPDDVQMVLGQSLNFPLKRGDPILWSDLEGDEASRALRGLSGRITKGERALAIPVDTISGVAGYIKANDRVDFLCTVQNNETGMMTTITLLQNITVLATGENTGDLFDEIPDESYSSLTVLVTLEEAELLVFAQDNGNLVAVLRNPEDVETIMDVPKMDFSNIMKQEFRNKLQKNRDRIEVIRSGGATGQ
ncbi:MAG: Flp pilus assembly protein CpaB [Deltaproteobacteria bacterium]|nr:Flp pilus assembly protein CpaB [Deltaproteobacteria bacterium]